MRPCLVQVYVFTCVAAGATVWPQAPLFRSGATGGSTVNFAICGSVAFDGLDVIAGLGDGNGFDELGRFAELAPGNPLLGIAGTSVVASEHGFQIPIPLLHEVAEVVGAEL